MLGRRSSLCNKPMAVLTPTKLQRKRNPALLFLAQALCARPIAVGIWRLRNFSGLSSFSDFWLGKTLWSDL
jgi:hypothetical protein